MLPGEVIWDQNYVQKHGEKNPYWPAQSVFTNNESGGHKATMCRTREWNYVYRMSEPDELYDLQSDPMESTNRIEDPVVQDVAERMKNRMMKWYVETTDVVPMDMDER